MEKITYVTYPRRAESDRAVKDRSVLLIDNEVAQQLLTVDDCLEVIEAAYREFGLQRASASRASYHVPRPPNGWYRWAPMASAITKLGVLAVRIKSDVIVEEKQRSEFYCVAPGKYCGLILLFSAIDGAPLAILHDGHIQHMRVGATGGLSVKHMARRDASTLGLLGSAGMATTHAWAIAKVRPIKRIKMFSPNPEHRKAFARQMSDDMGIPVVAVDDPQEIVEGADILASCTNSQSAVIKGEWLKPGVHVLSVSPQEPDDEVFRRCNRYVYSRTPSTEVFVAAPPEEQPPRMEGYIGTKWLAREGRLMAKEKITPLSDVVLGKAVGRANDDEITCFVSQGNPIQFTASAYRVYQLAKERGLGRKLPLEWFLQDIRD